MPRRFKNFGFSLAETLIALGILAVGMIFIAGAFPVAIQLMTQSTERSIGGVVAEEAFAKVRLYAKGTPVIDLSKLSQTELTDFNSPPPLGKNAFPAIDKVGQYEFVYPSTGTNLDPNSQYCWSALCKLTGPASENPPVQVTVFVCRKAGRSTQYHKPSDVDGTLDTTATSNWPRPIKIIKVSKNISKGANNQLKLPANEKTFVNDNYIIVDDSSGQIYRVIKRLPAINAGDDEIIELDRDWNGTVPNNISIWVVPPAVGGGRNPCIGVFQKDIKF